MQNITIVTKNKDSKILGTPYLVVIGDKQEGDLIELENNLTNEKQIVSIDKLIETIK